jgi:hypothetical protein
MRKVKFRMLLVATVSALSSTALFAQGWGYGVQHPGYGHKGYGQPQGRPVRDVGEPPAQFQPAGRPQGPQMTEEQRRQLHRDLDKANREIYGVPRR